MSTASTLCKTLEFRGHLIDSLTLSKVIDRIQELGGDYRLNDIRIGSQKKDISSVNLTLFADNQAKLDELVSDLGHYGGVPAGAAFVETMTIRQPGQLPEEAFTLQLPQRINYAGQLLDLQTDEAMVITVEAGQARLEKASLVRPGAEVVIGTQGIDWQ